MHLVVNYYRNLSERRSHTLLSLTNITFSKVKFKWNKIEQDAFYEIERTVAHDNLLAYPDFNEDFKIHTDANNLQLEAVIRQKGKPINFHCRNLLIPIKVIQ